MDKITIIRGCVTSAFRPAMRMSWWLLKIMLPISLAVRLLQYYGVIAWCAQWLEGFKDTPTSVRKTVETIKTHPLVPKDIVVRGFIIDSETGGLEEIL